MAEKQYNAASESHSSGPDGLPPGILKLLPTQWILMITNVFNSIFLSGVYPNNWS